MSDTSTELEQRLDEIEARCEAAKGGKWVHRTRFEHECAQDIPWLIAALRAAQAKLETQEAQAPCPVCNEATAHEIGGAALLEAATEYGVNQERAAAEALARELVKKYLLYWELLEEHFDHLNNFPDECWELRLFKQRNGSCIVNVYAPTQRECVEQALEMLREGSEGS